METRRAAGVICYRVKDQSILLLHHLPQGHWGIPKGHRDPDDASDIACALRELREEVGEVALCLIPHFRKELHYNVAAEYERCAYHKTVVHFLGLWPDDAGIELSHEHDAFRFARAEEVERLIPFPETCRLLIEAIELASKNAGGP